MRLYNTAIRKKEDFVPRTAGLVKMYTCGPTVYSDAHIGNLRTFIFEDVLTRALLFEGYRIERIMNITDVGHLSDDADEGDDKMQLAAQKEGKTAWDIAEFYTERFYKDFFALNCLKPDAFTKATEHIDQMIALIKRLEAKGCTYQAGGNVYFRISAFPEYGMLIPPKARKNMRATGRVAVDGNKEHPADFGLWFTNSKFGEQAMMWDSPWGRGYPGWHLECSAMAMQYLGEQADIHCGGVDAIALHHTNEIAQSEAATGKPWIKYWLHGEFLLAKAAKMSKSKGGTLTLTTLKEEGFDPMDYRYFLLGAHYRSQLNFSLEALQAARAGHLRILDKLASWIDIPLVALDNKLPSEGKLGELREEFAAAVADDLHMPRALACLWSALSSLEPSEAKSFVAWADQVLGLNLMEDAIKRHEELSQEPEAAELPAGAAELIAERAEARAAKDWARSDALRDELLAMGVAIKDGPGGSVTWELTV